MQTLSTRSGQVTGTIDGGVAPLQFRPRSVLPNQYVHPSVFNQAQGTAAFASAAILRFK